MIRIIILIVSCITFVVALSVQAGKDPDCINANLCPVKFIFVSIVMHFQAFKYFTGKCFE